jgi:hypothetical protein
MPSRKSRSLPEVNVRTWHFSTVASSWTGRSAPSRRSPRDANDPDLPCCTAATVCLELCVWSPKVGMGGDTGTYSEDVAGGMLARFSGDRACLWMDHPLMAVGTARAGAGPASNQSSNTSALLAWSSRPIHTEQAASPGTIIWLAANRSRRLLTSSI